MSQDLVKTKAIVELLRQTTSIPVVTGFLKNKGLRHSAGSWEELLTSRILPAAEHDQIQNSELIGLLRSAEECGKQHIFLYFCPAARAKDLIDRARVTVILTRKGIENLLVEAKILAQPGEAEIVDVRWETAKIDLSLIIKVIELRKTTRFVGTEVYAETKTFHKVYAQVEERAVNVAKLHHTGLLEIRIASHANSSKYEDDVNVFWKHFGDFFPIGEFKELSLSEAKSRLWKERDALADRIRYTDSTIKNGSGASLKASTGSEKSDLVGDDAVSKGLDFVLKNDDDAYCEGSNIWFKQHGDLSGDVHVLLCGEMNEYALPGNCNEEDYKHVLSELRTLNKRIP